MSERVYTTIDKSEWGPGAWQDEPDKIQWRDEETGLPCLVNRGPGGNWCGYVGVSRDHPFYEQPYNDHYDVEVHGGLTYADHCAHGPEESSICHIPDPGEPDDVWWFGFDCGHSMDIAPEREARDRKRYEQTGDPLWLPLRGPWEEVYRTVDYAREQTTELARQLHEQSLVEGARVDVPHVTPTDPLEQAV